MKNNKNVQSYAWDTFSKTGKIGYYLFYKALSEYGEHSGTDNKGHNAEKDTIS